jgi:hypothetical protein
MFYRRKILLSLFQLFEGDLEKIRLHKLLFLFSLKQQKPNYDFIPYKYGCYSYSANADLTTMVKQKLLSETDMNFTCDLSSDYLNMLNQADRNELMSVKEIYGEFDSGELMRYTYLNYPFFAINSIKAKEILTKDELKVVESCKPSSNDTLLYTIGYEGISLETYLNKLILNNIKVLVDVRNNPQSMKYGFSRIQLIKYCEGLGIKYIHFPELGISSNQRQSLKNQNDYDELFSFYKLNNLVETKSYQIAIVNLLDKHKRIALTCFEKNICQCHRKHLAESLEVLYDYQHKVMHI